MLPASCAGRVGFNREMGALDSVEQGQGEDASEVMLRTTEETTRRVFEPYRTWMPWDTSARAGKQAVRQFRVRPGCADCVHQLDAEQIPLPSAAARSSLAPLRHL